jgi:hypothetical protein
VKEHATAEARETRDAVVEQAEKARAHVTHEPAPRLHLDTRAPRTITKERDLLLAEQRAIAVVGREDEVSRQIRDGDW